MRNVSVHIIQTNKERKSIIIIVIRCREAYFKSVSKILIYLNFFFREKNNSFENFDIFRQENIQISEKKLNPKVWNQ